MAPLATVLAFVDAINAADVDAISDLLAEDHVFIDSDGTKVRGREAMREAWIGYFRMMPDYRIAVQEALADRDTVVLTGSATGTYAPDGRPSPEGRWTVPAAWRAVVKGERVALWQVFVNPEPIRRVMRRRSREAG
jgi:uncharacterized protein (TIGR02246 family)